MPRSARHAPGGLVYHVLNRAAGRFKLFRTPRDFAAFCGTLAEALDRHPGIRLLGFCVMSNHWHLLLWPREGANLGRFMHWLTLAHASRWRTSHGTVGLGPLYQGRYRSFAVQGDRHYLTVLRYIERNALRASAVKRAEHWPWGSLRLRLLPRDPPAADAAMQAKLSARLADGPMPLPRDWVGTVNAPQTAAEEEALRTSIQRSRPFGQDAWQHATARRLGLKSCFRRPGRPKTNRKNK